MNIGEITDMVGIYENALSDELTLSNIQTLLNLYAQAIEYYSALGDPEHEQYLYRQIQLLKQPEINAVLNSQIEEEHHQKELLKQSLTNSEAPPQPV
jgi:hypothetical protein